MTEVLRAELNLETGRSEQGVQKVTAELGKQAEAVQKVRKARKDATSEAETDAQRMERMVEKELQALKRKEEREAARAEALRRSGREAAIASEVTVLGQGRVSKALDEGNSKAAAMFGTFQNGAKVTAGAVAALVGVLTQVLKAIQEVDNAQGKMRTERGGTLTDLSASLTGMGITGETQEKVIDNLRATGGAVTQAQLNAFVGQLGTANASLTPQQVTSAARAYGQAAPFLGSGEGVAQAFAILGPEATGDEAASLALRFSQASGGKGLTATTRRGIERMTGMGIPLERALGLAAVLSESGQAEGLDPMIAAAGQLSAKYTRAEEKDMFGQVTRAGQTISPNDALNFILTGAGGEELPAIQPILAALGQRGRRGMDSGTGPDAVGRDVLQGGLSQYLRDNIPASVREELGVRSAVRAEEIARGLDGDAAGDASRIRSAMLDRTAAGLDASGDVFRSSLLRTARGIYGDRLTSWATGTSDPSADIDRIREESLRTERIFEQIELNTRGGRQ